MNIIKSTLSVASVLATGLLFSTQVLADDAKTFAGATCEAYLGSESSDFQATTSNEIRNNSDGFRWIECPIVRDRTVNSNGFRSAQVFASHTNTSCRIYSRTATGGARDVEIRNGSTMNFNQINLSSLRGSYHMICRLPSGGRLRSYTVHEFTPTHS